MALTVQEQNGLKILLQATLNAADALNAAGLVLNRHKAKPV